MLENSYKKRLGLLSAISINEANNIIITGFNKQGYNYSINKMIVFGVEDIELIEYLQPRFLQKGLLVIKYIVNKKLYIFYAIIQAGFDIAVETFLKHLRITTGVGYKRSGLTFAELFNKYYLLTIKMKEKHNISLKDKK